MVLPPLTQRCDNRYPPRVPRQKLQLNSDSGTLPMCKHRALVGRRTWKAGESWKKAGQPLKQDSGLQPQNDARESWGGEQIVGVFGQP